jgi:hypothetical protein
MNFTCMNEKLRKRLSQCGYEVQRQRFNTYLISKDGSHEEFKEGELLSWEIRTAISKLSLKLNAVDEDELRED